MRDLGLRFVRHNLFWPTLALVLLLLLNLTKTPDFFSACRTATSTAA